MSTDAVPVGCEQDDKLGELPVISHLIEAALNSKQRADQSLSHVISRIAQLSDLPLLLQELESFALLNNMLYNKR